MYKVYTAHEVLEVNTLDEAKQAVASEWNLSGEADSTGFVNPYIEDSNGNQIDYTPTKQEVKTWLD
jgi:hypothetical protein